MASDPASDSLFSPVIKNTRGLDMEPSRPTSIQGLDAVYNDSEPTEVEGG